MLRNLKGLKDWYKNLNLWPTMQITALNIIFYDNIKHFYNNYLQLGS